MCSSSEIQRVSLAAARSVVPSGTVNIDPSYRQKLDNKQSSAAKTSSTENGN